MLEKNEIIQSALRNLKIEELNPMQEASLEQATGRKDVILLSPTGSGKTLAYLLPLLLTLKPNDDSVQVLILVPSRELALQIDSVFKAMGTSWKTCCCYGGHPIAEEKKSILGNHPAIIIGTPGRITDHLSKGNFNPETIETLIIDEFDKSLEFGFHDEMAEIITQLPGLKKRMLLSATDAEEIPEFTGLNRTVKLNFLSDDSEEQESRLKLMKVLSPSKDKIDTLYNLLCTLGSASSIVFCNHRDAVDRVHQLLADKKLLAERFHGGMEQPDRERALYKFRNGSCHVLISTDLAARGLDIPEVGHIIHYHLPVNEEAFTHRNGRTARWDATGTSYLILHAEEKLPSYILEEMEIVVLPENPPRPPKSVWATYPSLAKQLEDFGSGIEITLLAAIPAGSGLGTSSILASTVLGAINDFCGLAWDKNDICSYTLVLEQLLTTGGGWQDQYGGVFSGIKLLQSEAGFEQNPLVRWLPDQFFVHPDYRDCHLLYYTGITRTAKSILAEIVSSMFLNSGPHLSLLAEMKAHAMDMSEAILRSNFESFGRLVGKTWIQNQALDCGTNPPAVAAIIEKIKDYTLGYKLPGAGGGGYLYMVAKDPQAAGQIRRILTEQAPNPRARFVEMTLSDKGLQVSRS